MYRLRFVICMRKEGSNEILIATFATTGRNPRDRPYLPIDGRFSRRI